MQTKGASELQPGTLVGEYQITGRLGEGGMGVVYAGQHPEIGKRVAIKVLAQHAAERPDLIRRFKEEARAVNKIRHPNIIDIFAFNQLPDGRHYFVMEYLEGESLTSRLERGPMDLAELHRLLGQICSALRAAHEAGIVHRDLKPDNIWVANQTLAESRIKLLDFGIAKLSDVGNLNATQAGVAMGTPHYMPPEQGLGRAIDARTDIYALGVVLYQIFAGTVPFDGVTAHEIVMKQVTEAPLPPSRHRPIVPSGMEAIILDCLQKEPDRRPPSIEALWQRIDAAFAAAAKAVVPGRAPTVVPRLPTADPAPAVSNLTSLSGMAGDVELDVPKRSRRPLAFAIGAVIAAGGLVTLLVARRPPHSNVPAASESGAASSPAAPAAGDSPTPEDHVSGTGTPAAKSTRLARSAPPAGAKPATSQPPASATQPSPLPPTPATPAPIVPAPTPVVPAPEAPPPTAVVPAPMPPPATVPQPPTRGSDASAATSPSPSSTSPVTPGEAPTSPDNRNQRPGSRWRDRSAPVPERFRPGSRRKFGRGASEPESP